MQTSFPQILGKKGHFLSRKSIQSIEEDCKNVSWVTEMYIALVLFCCRVCHCTCLAHTCFRYLSLYRHGADGFHKWPGCGLHPIWRKCLCHLLAICTECNSKRCFNLCAVFIAFINFFGMSSDMCRHVKDDFCFSFTKTPHIPLLFRTKKMMIWFWKHTDCVVKNGAMTRLGRARHF